MVNVNISGIHYQVSDKVRNYVDEKIGHLDRFYSKLSKVIITIHTAEKDNIKVDAEMRIDNHKVLMAHDTEETVYAAIDAIYDKCSKQLRRMHDKETSQMKQGG